ncbi:glycosyltransferase family 2 protein [Roseivivax sp. CAU 1753]
MQTTAAALTMVRDDAFFLDKWLRYYGGLFGRENCYVINHGRGEMVADMAAGCNVIGLPGDPHPQFERKRWRLLNSMVTGLLGYYTHVVVGDVDEVVVIDPETGHDLLSWLEAKRRPRVYTPVGLDVTHRIDRESDEIGDHVIGPRRHVKLLPHHSKPCILGKPAQLSRGGHFAKAEKLNTPEGLYLLHLKFCDFGQYVEAMNRRNAVIEAIGVDVKETSIGRHWFADARGEDRAVFEAFETLDERDGFDLGWLRAEMQSSWQPRGQTGFWQFDRPEYGLQYQLPARFDGIV